MLEWKRIQGRWHLIHEDISICRLVQQVATQTNSKVCPACLDAIAIQKLQWQRLNLSRLMMKQDSWSLREVNTNARDVDEIL